MKLLKKNLEMILQKGECQTVEFKESFSSSLAKEIVAFANAGGGKIFLGITDSNQITGISINNNLKSKIIDLAKNCDPSIRIGFQELENIFIIEVEKGTNKPYQCKDGFFLRQGTNSQKQTRYEII